MRRLVALLCCAPLVALACDRFKDDEPCAGGLCEDGGLDATGRVEASPDVADVNVAPHDAGADADADADATSPDASDASDASEAGRDAADLGLDASPFEGGTPVVGLELALGYAHSCALFGDHTVKCWGSTVKGQLGIGDAGGFDGSVPVAVPGLDHVIAIGSSAAAQHTCAVSDDGGVACWGENDHGQTGPDASDSYSPTAIPGIGPMRAVGASDFSSCGVLADDSAMQCWGVWSWSYFGGVGTITGFDGRVTSFNGTSSGYCAAYGDGSVGCFGDNGDDSENLFGFPDAGASPTPVPVPGVTNVVHVSAGAWGHACAALADGRVTCWGSNQSGESGASPSATPAPPTVVPGIDDAVQVSTGYLVSCARKRDGTVACWGDNSDWRCGAAGAASFSTPHVVPGLTHVTNLASGAGHSCAVVEGSRVFCWGADDQGQLGDGAVGPARGPTEVKL